jgi:predicted permease
MDGRILAFTFSVSILTAILFGLVPALRATRVDLIVSLRNQGVTTEPKHDGWRLHKALVVAQVAVSLLLLVGAGLFLRSLQNLRSTETGFDAEGVLLLELDPQGGGYAQEQLPQLYEDLLARVESLPEVRSASLSLFSLFYGGRWISEAAVDGYTQKNDRDLQIEATMVTPEYFETVGVPLILGRGFHLSDREGAPQVAIVNETFARHFFAGESPIGKRFGIGGEESSRDIEIVGMVKDLKYHRMREDAPRFIYFPVMQQMDWLNSLQIRTSGDPAAVAPMVRRAVTDVADNLPILEVKTLTEQIDRSLRGDQLISRLTSFFGLLALLLASIGLYGVMAYAVAQRTNEIGIRIALGAGRSQVLWMVMRDGMILVGIGVVLGILASLASTRLASSLLFGLGATDLATMAGATLILCFVAIFAGYLPARRAAGLDPSHALRYE